MRIGILTLPLHANYGGILQAYALQTVLERMGNKVYVLGSEFKPKDISLRQETRWMLRQVKHFITKEGHLALSYKAAQRDIYNTRIHYTSQFVKKYIHERTLKSLHDITPNDFDAIVVGSDQIWRTQYNQKWTDQKLDDVFLGFTKGWKIRRVAYAASFGTNSLEIGNADLESCQKAIKLFNAVSVREDSGIDICSKKLDTKAVLMPDPTMLLTSDDYIKLIHREQNLNKHQLLSYILAETKDNARLREYIAKQKHLEINIVNNPIYYDKNKKLPSQPPVENWLQGFAECDYVITDSFHACVFSILFHKPFTAIANRSGGVDRFESLLKMFGLENRLVYSVDEYKEMPDVNWEKIDCILKSNRAIGLNFLKETLYGNVNN